MADSRIFCLLCESVLYSEQSVCDHTRTRHGCSAEEGQTYETHAQREERVRLEAEEDEREQERLGRLVEWECERAAEEWAGIETADDFLRACRGAA